MEPSVREMERVMGFEPTTFCLGSRHSTPELHPLVAVSRLYQLPFFSSIPGGLSCLTRAHFAADPVVVTDLCHRSTPLVHLDPR